MVMMEGEAENKVRAVPPPVRWCGGVYLLMYFEAEGCGVGALSRWGRRWIAHSSVMAIFPGLIASRNKYRALV